MLEWHWEQVDASRSAHSGDIAKLFRNEGTEEPGCLASGAPGPDARTLAREVLQNSWDAARALQAEDETAPGFEIRFIFGRAAGQHKHRLVSYLGLHGHAARTRSCDRTKLGLSEADCLTALDEETPLRLLRIDESSTTGMYGPFTGPQSKLYLALVSVGITLKAEGDGGTFGYGKAGLVRGSSIRTVIAYTCFRERDDDRGVTRRLLGMTYWGLHEYDGEVFTGFARLGVRGGGVTVPFENADADRVAADLGLPVRDADDPEQLGTTFLLVEPTTEPDELRRAIERSWWPAISDGDFLVDIETDDGQRFVPRPKADPVLLPFVRAYELATTRQDARVRGEWHRTFNALNIGGRRLHLGAVGLVADTSSWAFPTSDEGGDDGVDHRSLVALVRGPRMVVEYLDAGRQPPFVRGTFVAHEEIDDLLRQSEPKAHDRWQTHAAVDDVSPDAHVIASAVLGRVRTSVNEFRRSLRPPRRQAEAVRLPILDQLLRRISGRRGPVPPATGNSVQVAVVDDRLEAVDDGAALRYSAHLRMSLTDPSVDSEDVEIVVRYHFLEDGRAVAPCPLEIDAPQGFAASGGDNAVFAGRLGPEPVQFAVRTIPYDLDWTAKLSIAVSTLDMTGVS